MQSVGGSLLDTAHRLMAPGHARHSNYTAWISRDDAQPKRYHCNAVYRAHKYRSFANFCYLPCHWQRKSGKSIRSSSGYSALRKRHQYSIQRLVLWFLTQYRWPIMVRDVLLYIRDPWWINGSTFT